jgi:hypothetical protein
VLCSRDPPPRRSRRLPNFQDEKRTDIFDEGLVLIGCHLGPTLRRRSKKTIGQFYIWPPGRRLTRAEVIGQHPTLDLPCARMKRPASRLQDSAGRRYQHCLQPTVWPPPITHDACGECLIASRKAIQRVSWFDAPAVRVLPGPMVGNARQHPDRNRSNATSSCSTPYRTDVLSRSSL